ncbi:hypothetical protein HAX54_022734, partial [Datura stramonium]|nr:hypothetical protein [Datura stramonium]
YHLNKHARAFCRVRLEVEEPLDDDVPTKDKQAQDESNLDSDANKGEDTEMGDTEYAPRENELDPGSSLFHSIP